MVDTYNLYPVLSEYELVFSCLRNLSDFNLFCRSNSYPDRAVKRNKRRSHFLQVNDIVSATDIPSVTLVAPAFNEGMTIVENVKSLLSIQYPFYEFILVNDGSKDNSMELLIKNMIWSHLMPLLFLSPFPRPRSTRSIKAGKNSTGTSP